MSSELDSQISTSKVYTHTLDPGTAGLANINGVAFTRITKDTASYPLNFYYQPSEPTRDDHVGNDNHNVSGELVNLFRDMIYDGGNPAGGTATVTLSGLLPGYDYDARIYTRRWGGNNRQATISFDTDGLPGAEDSVYIHEDDATQTPPGFADPNQAYALSYQFTAQTDQIQIGLTQQNTNASWHLYGLTNEFVTTPPPLMQATITGDDSYELYLSSDPNQPGTLVGSAGGWETPELYTEPVAVGEQLYLHIVGNNGFSAGGDWAGVIGQFDFILPEGYFLMHDPDATRITTGADWMGNATGFGDPSVPVTDVAGYGGSPWGTRPGVGAFDASAHWIWHGAPLIGQGDTYSPVYLSFPFKILVPEPAAAAVWAGLLGLALSIRLRRRRT
jgi:hypothetical protein